MKRVLTFLAVLLALVAVSACNYDVNLSVDASAELTYSNGDLVRVAPVTFEGYHRKSFSDSDLEQIFINLTRNVNPDFVTAILYLQVFDEISGAHLRDETYGVVYNVHTGRYDFADMDVVY